MSKFQSTKILELGSCAFRQPAAKSHCRFLHGYRLTAKFWFEAKELDNNHWVLDFGSMGDFKEILRDQFDHTTCIASDDPVLPFFEQLHNKDVVDLRVMENGTGIERIAEWCYKAANKFIPGKTDNRCRCVKVEVFEHSNNSAVYTSEIGTSKDLTQPPFKVKEPVHQELKLDMGEPYAEGRATKEKLPDPPEEIIVPESPPKGPPEEKHGLGDGQVKTKNSWVDPKYKGKTKNSWLF